MITISDKTTIDFYLGKNTKDMTPYEILKDITKNFAKEFDIDSNLNLFFPELIKTKRNLLNKSHNASYNFIKELNNTDYYFNTVLHKNFEINLLYGINKVYRYVDIYLINPLKNKKYCTHFRIFDKIKNFPRHRTYIFWIKTKDPYFNCQDMVMKGTDVLNFITDFSKILNVEIIELEESSYRYCQIDKYNTKTFLFSTLDWITKGKTWYERNNFKPTLETSIREEDRYNLPLIPYEKVSENKYKKFEIKYKNAIKFIGNISINKLAAYYRKIVYNPKLITQTYNVSKRDLNNFIICLNMIEKYLKDNKKTQLKHFINWLYYKIDCYYYIIFVESIRDLDPIWDEPKAKNNKLTLHYYNKKILKDDYLDKISENFIFLTQKNYFYKLI